jgi:hypothetical protein
LREGAASQIGDNGRLLHAAAPSADPGRAAGRGSVR